jgi:carboxypeptidase Q
MNCRQAFSFPARIRIALVPLFLMASFLMSTVVTAPALGADSRNASEAVAIQLRTQAMGSQDIAYSWVSELATRFGARPAGSASENLAAVWAADQFKSLGFENVRIETFPLTSWVRGTERAEIIAPGTQSLAAAALGGSPPTPARGIEGEVVVFPTLEDLIAAPKGSVNGKIAMVARRTVRMQDISGYAAVVPARMQGPTEAASKGAIGFLLRSISTDNHRLPHTGATLYVDGRVPIPAFAVATPDADQIERLVAMGQTVRVRLTSAGSFVRDAHSQNVVAEIRGRERPQDVIVLGAHLDSWDLGTGAVDDGAGSAIVTAAAKLIRDLPQRPLRTVRVVLFGSEEVTQPVTPFHVFGGNAYASTHESELKDHMLAAESDMGADRVYALRLPQGVPADSDLAKTIFRVLTPLGILPTDQVTETGIDISPIVETGVPTFGLYQDLTRYFDLHHSADDTLAKIERQPLDQNVAAWAVVTWLTANSDVDFRAVSQPAVKKGVMDSLFSEPQPKK